MSVQSLKIVSQGAVAVSALLIRPANARGCLVLAHGAGAGMSHPFMEMVATGLAERGIASLRYQFPYMEKGSKRPDAPKVAHDAVRAAVAEAALHCPGVPLVAATIAGWLIGDSATGLLVGAALELIALDTLPFGASRYPEWGSAAVVGGAIFATHPSHPAGAMEIQHLARDASRE